MVLDAVLFDLGGTLLHYQTTIQPDFREVTMRGILRMRAALLEFGFEPPAEQTFGEVVNRHIGDAYMACMSDLRGGSIETPLRSALEEMGAENKDGQWAELRKGFYSLIDEVVNPRKGARDTLVSLRDRGLKLALISNTYWAADVHDRHLSEHNLLDLLPVRVYSCDTERTKPHVSIFANTLAEIGVEAEKAVYVGDKLEIDILGAQGADMRAVLIKSPYIDYDANDITPDAIVDELPELLDKLHSWQ